MRLGGADPPGLSKCDVPRSVGSTEVREVREVEEEVKANIKELYCLFVGRGGLTNHSHRRDRRA